MAMKPTYTTLRDTIPFRACLRWVVSVQMSNSVDGSHLQQNHKWLKSPNFISGQPLKVTID